jgi:hypothetical protein
MPDYGAIGTDVWKYCVAVVTRSAAGEKECRNEVRQRRSVGEQQPAKSWHNRGARGICQSRKEWGLSSREFSV